MNTPAHMFVKCSPQIVTNAESGASFLNITPQHVLRFLSKTACFEIERSNAETASLSDSFLSSVYILSFIFVSISLYGLYFCSEAGGESLLF